MEHNGTIIKDDDSVRFECACGWSISHDPGEEIAAAVRAQIHVNTEGRRQTVNAG